VELKRRAESNLATTGRLCSAAILLSAKSIKVDAINGPPSLMPRALARSNPACVRSDRRTASCSLTQDRIASSSDRAGVY